MSLNLTQRESTFLLMVLDEVSVKGLENKAMVVSIMTKVSETVAMIQPRPGPNVDKPKRKRKSSPKKS